MNTNFGPRSIFWWRSSVLSKSRYHIKTIENMHYIVINDWRMKVRGIVETVFILNERVQKIFTHLTDNHLNLGLVTKNEFRVLINSNFWDKIRIQAKEKLDKNYGNSAQSTLMVKKLFTEFHLSRMITNEAERWGPLISGSLYAKRSTVRYWSTRG